MGLLGPKCESRLGQKWQKWQQSKLKYKLTDLHKILQKFIFYWNFLRLQAKCLLACLRAHLILTKKFSAWVYWKLFCLFWPIKTHNFAHIVLPTLFFLVNSCGYPLNGSVNDFLSRKYWQFCWCLVSNIWSRDKAILRNSKIVIFDKKTILRPPKWVLFFSPSHWIGNRFFFSCQPNTNKAITHAFTFIYNI